MPSDPDSLKVIIDNIYELIASEQYDEAEHLLGCIPDLEKHDPELLFFKAICEYEAGRDVECLQLLSDFLNRAPRHVKADYSVFTAAICLANLGMEEESLPLLNTLPVSYPDLIDEKQSISAKVQIKAQAKVHAEAIAKMSRKR
ncbi:MAG: hypothetical protein ABJF10_20985 [Chthoniobacter sp.]|uniref:hypothetical protein n=1 Tax=Chthoniobacter sp. TaxID=2510640 RepID=UPI0032A7FEF3